MCSYRISDMFFSKEKKYYQLNFKLYPLRSIVVTILPFLERILRKTSQKFPISKTLAQILEFETDMGVDKKDLLE